MTDTTKPKCPKGLTPETRRWWGELVSRYEFESHHLRLLETACRAWDRAVEADAILADAGLIYVDRLGAPRQHPAVNVARDARDQFVRAVKALGLDIEETKPVGRPAGR